MNEYKIMLGQEVVGQANVVRDGLYYHIRCECDLKTGIICRVVASNGDHNENLGILVPQSGIFTLTKSIPIKRLGGGSIDFRIIPKHDKREGKFIAVYPQEPFRYIRQLQNAFMEYRQKHAGVVIKESLNAFPAAVQLDSDHCP